MSSYEEKSSERSKKKGRIERCENTGEKGICTIGRFGCNDVKNRLDRTIKISLMETLDRSRALLILVIRVR